MGYSHPWGTPGVARGHSLGDNGFIQNPITERSTLWPRRRSNYRKNL